MIYKLFFYVFCIGISGRIQILNILLAIGSINDRQHYKQGRLNTEDDREMGKETIIFFENLGFGWVLDDVDLEHMSLGAFHDEIVVNNSLMKIIENLLSDNQRY